MASASVCRKIFLAGHNAAARVANHSTGFGASYPLTARVIHIMRDVKYQLYSKPA